MSLQWQRTVLVTSSPKLLLVLVEGRPGGWDQPTGSFPGRGKAAGWGFPLALGPPRRSPALRGDLSGRAGAGAGRKVRGAVGSELDFRPWALPVVGSLGLSLRPPVSVVNLAPD